MAAFDTHAPVRFSGRIGQVLAFAVASITAWNDARVTRNALSDLSDRELDDIGLSRGDIENIR